MCVCVCVCVCVYRRVAVCVCVGWGGGGVRKEARACPFVRGENNNNWAMETKFNAPTVNFILFLFCLVFYLFAQFLLQVYRFKMSIS